MPASLQIKLSQEENKALLELSMKDGVPHRVKQRASVVRLNARGWKVKQIAEYWNWADQTVRQAIHRWLSGGIEGLWEADGRGRKRKWTDSHWQQMEQWLEEPRRYSAAQLQKKWEQACGVKVGKEQVRRLVKKKARHGNECAPAHHL
ncbi:helix-turn-helix domain-containing protein [Nostoc sp. FACHB-280]|uniref:helix-turn-helix domain-containing protein n=1 Tax=Nostoc sp. FACHB-280 TaxID=2692839 RepID=UPI00168AF613|nr:helix-turn-helix domain-containing protein [Nostoc sp. FACHB-280]MBD2496921.1 helix-turn-helix domain-containing protein [Nostoc sp. FACHB-280]